MPLDRERASLVQGLLMGVLVGFILAIGFLAAFGLVSDLTGFSAVSASPSPNSASASQNTGTQPLPANAYSASADIVAVDSQTNAGVLNKATVEIQPGQGRILFDLNPFVEPDTQQSAEIAAVVASQVTGQSLATFDLVYSIDSQAQLVGGPSAGGALTIATIAAIEHKTVNPDVVLTGTIQPDGSIGQVGGVLEKAQAVAQAGKKLFLVPAGQSMVTTYEPHNVMRHFGPFQIAQTRMIPKTVDLVAYAQQQWGLQVKEVSTIQEAMPYMLS